MIRRELAKQDLHLHIHLENNILFPRATELEAHVCESSLGFPPVPNSAGLTSGK